MSAHDDDFLAAAAGAPGRDEIALPPSLPAHLRRSRLRRSEVVEYLAAVHGIVIAPSTLAKWAGLGRGPAFSRLHRQPWYGRAEIDRWVAATLKPVAPHGTPATSG